MNTERYTVTNTLADLLDHPQNGPRIGRRDSQLLYGESFKAQRQEGSYFFGQSETDGYEGYIHEDFLTPLNQESNHAVSVLIAHIYPEPTMKTRPVKLLSFLSKLTVIENKTQDGFVEVPEQGWIWNNHIRPLTDMPFQSDLTQTALMFMHVPYLYGGRSAFGIDCSGLTQISLQAAGIMAPRDADMQENTVGDAVDFRDPLKPQNLQAGDLVYMKQHTGVMLNDRHCLNATARHMCPVIEDIQDLANIYDGLTSVRRLYSRFK